MWHLVKTLRYSYKAMFSRVVISVVLVGVVRLTACAQSHVGHYWIHDIRFRISSVLLRQRCVSPVSLYNHSRSVRETGLTRFEPSTRAYVHILARKKISTRRSFCRSFVTGAWWQLHCYCLWTTWNDNGWRQQVYGDERNLGNGFVRKDYCSERFVDDFSETHIWPRGRAGPTFDTAACRDLVARDRRWSTTLSIHCRR